MYNPEKINEILNDQKLKTEGKTQGKLKEYMHSCTPRHVLKVELEPDIRELHRTEWYSNKIRLAGNELTATMNKRLGQMKRTRKWKAALEEYRLAAEAKKKVPEDAADAVREAAKDRLTKAGGVLENIQKEFLVTWEDCRKEMIRIGDGNNYSGIGSIFLLSKAEDIWKGVEAVLYRDGKRLSFSAKGEYPSIRAKQANRGIIPKLNKDGELVFQMDLGGEKPVRHKIGIKPVGNDRFLKDEIAKLVAFLDDPDKNEDKAVDEMLHGRYFETFRPCYVTFVLKEIRGKVRLFAHITIDGVPCPKYKKDGSPRHKYGTGRVGNDIGTQSLAYTSRTEVGLENLSERGGVMRGSEREERLLKRKMERSRRAMNPGNYKEDGTIKKGKKKWKKSKRYRKIQQEYRELCRKNAASRKYAADEQAWRMRALGDVLVTEPKNAKELQRKAKKPADGSVAKDKNGKCKKRKRFGKSIQNRCPGYYQEKVKQVFLSTRGRYYEVDRMFRASQYDHTLDDYVKKKLSDRKFKLSDGTEVQRDSYSSFLLYCADDAYMCPDRARCLKDFVSYYEKEQRMEESIRSNHIHVCNSGIKCA